MKTIYLFVLATLLCYISASGQNWRIAPTVGLNASAISYSTDFRNSLNAGSYNTKTGLLVRGQIGALIDYATSDRFSIRSGLLYTAKGGNLTVSTSQYGVNQTAQASYQLNYIEIPLLLNIAVGDNGYRLVGGPVLGLTLNGKAVVESGNYAGYGYLKGNTTNFRVGSGLTDDILPTDLSVSVGIVKELEVGDRPLEIGLHVQPSFSKWNTRSQTEPNYYARNLLVGLRVAYLFDLRR